MRDVCVAIKRSLDYLSGKIGPLSTQERIERNFDIKHGNMK